ncbi:peptidoglycan DD-metalloendopeptidase family protein [Parafilimonas terrae]|uniref:Peptidase family M23 n=1 Tax=Parafilimonas terrae TaxID=1465490 RepID=A0A1I5SCW3_9BACT|nr:peptidoglycan DD-metalloendopeptidase family protein [Parafilimonas terrae]SFP68562.1 Peptidase family M23 [Parafilimonas terrae]
MLNNPRFTSVLKKYQDTFHAVVPFNAAKDKLLLMNFTATNADLNDKELEDAGKFSAYIDKKIKDAGAVYGIGGYTEYRSIYNRSDVFDVPGAEPWRLHLGVDIWCNAGTPVFAFMGGMVHSLAFNNRFGDYGATLILLHQLDGIAFYSLYGHISLNDINNRRAGEYITRGEKFAQFGKPEENGNWPPHLHFQLIYDMEMKKGDYPGVCAYGEKEKYLKNCPDPDLVLNMMQYAQPD